MEFKRLAAILRPPKSWPLIKRFWPFMRPQRRALIGLVAISLLSLPTGMISPLLVKYLIDNVVRNRDVNKLLMVTIALVGLALIAQVLNYSQMVLARRFHLLVVHRMGRHFFA